MFLLDGISLSFLLFLYEQRSKWGIYAYYEMWVPRGRQSADVLY